MANTTKIYYLSLLGLSTQINYTVLALITQNEKEIENIRVNEGGSVEEWWRWTDGWGCWLPRECVKK
jgi:hypothetical protein